MPINYKQTAPLSENFTPSELLARTEQLQQLLNRTLVPYDNSNVWIEGDSGFGKTLTTRFFMREVESRKAGKTFYIACERSLKNSLEELCRVQGLRIPRASISAVTIADEILQKFPDAPRYIFILDEPEKVYKTTVSDIANFVHPLYNHMVMQRKNFNIVFVSRDTQIRASRYLPKDTLSRLRLQGIIFPRYVYPQVSKIITQRLNLVLDTDQYQRRAIIRICQHIYRIGGDIRQALQILRHAIFDLAADKLTLEIAEQAIEWGKIEWWKAQLTERLPGPHWAFVAFIAAELAMSDETEAKSESFVIDQQTVMKRYVEKCAETGLKPLGASSVYYIIDQIDKRYGFFKQRLEGARASLLFEKNDRNHILKAGGEVDWSEIFAFEQPLQLTMSVTR